MKRVKIPGKGKSFVSGIFCVYMDITARQLTEGDYDTLKEWWKWWRFPAPERHMLPSNGLGGFMIEFDGIEIAAGFLYFTNSSFAFCEYIVSNPDVRDNEVREKAIVALMNKITDAARDGGVAVIFTFLKNSNLEKKFLQAGYQLGTSGGKELIKIVQ